MFKNYMNICDVVSLLVYCPAEKAYLLSKESNGEFWLPSSKTEKNCWKMSAHKLNFEVRVLNIDFFLPYSTFII